MYEHSGIKEYWIVDPDNKEIEVYLLNNDLNNDKFTLDDIYRLPKEKEAEEYKLNSKTKLNVSLFPTLEIDLNDIFEDVIEW